MVFPGTRVTGMYGSRKVIAVFGDPIDTAPYKKLGNRLASHKRIADDLLARIYALSSEERAVRASG